MNRIERYLGSIVFNHFLLVMLVMMVIFAFFEFMNQLGDVNDRYTLGLSSLYTILKLPVYSYEAFPVVLLIGALMGLGALANQSELTVLRVTGWSIKRILFAVIKTALLICLLMLFIGEVIAPQSEAYAKKIKAEAMNKSLSIGSGDGFWIKDEDNFIFVEQVLSNSKLAGIQIYGMQDGKLAEIIQAEEANFDEAWNFIDIDKQELVNSSSPVTEKLLLNIKTSTEAQLKMDFPLLPEDITNLDIESRYLSAWSLYKQIRFMQQHDLDASPYLLSFWRKVSMPLLVVAMIAVVFPLIFGSMRQVGVGQRIFLGVLIGMSFHLINQLAGNLAVVYQLPIALAAFLPAFLLIGGAYYWLEKVD